MKETNLLLYTRIEKCNILRKVDERTGSGTNFPEVLLESSEGCTQLSTFTVTFDKLLELNAASTHIYWKAKNVRTQSVFFFFKK